MGLSGNTDQPQAAVAFFPPVIVPAWRAVEPPRQASFLPLPAAWPGQGGRFEPHPGPSHTRNRPGRFYCLWYLTIGYVTRQMGGGTMNPPRPTLHPRLHGERPAAVVLGELIAAAESVADDASPTRLSRLISALEKYGAWSAYNVSRQDQFALDLARGVMCAHAARPAKLKDGAA
jgi:hypothetical protein